MKLTAFVLLFTLIVINSYAQESSKRITNNLNSERSIQTAPEIMEEKNTQKATSNQRIPSSLPKEVPSDTTSTNKKGNVTYSSKRIPE
ncbi:MAG: hypothetical protein H0V01_09760 [Bacteroidetes bacterium]|nr:hypothetical protein [Bacteroidota bacterium]HET6243132.1 hypothetical protein [Bacteroidia bacterium]